MDVKRFTEGSIGKGLYSDPTGELCGFHHVERLTAERDALQLRLNAVEEENDRLRKLLGKAHPLTNDIAHDPHVWLEIDQALEKRP